MTRQCMRLCGLLHEAGGLPQSNCTLCTPAMVDPSRFLHRAGVASRSFCRGGAS